MCICVFILRQRACVSRDFAVDANDIVDDDDDDNNNNNVH